MQSGTLLVVANASVQEYFASMSAERILELEQLLAAANDSIAKLTASNTELTKQAADAELRSKKLRRNSRRDESSLRQQLTVAQNRKF